MQNSTNNIATKQADYHKKQKISQGQFFKNILSVSSVVNKKTSF
jgi:hypothetical protein